MKCQRCEGRVLRDREGGAACFVCGWEYVDDREVRRAEWFVDWNSKRSRTASRAEPGLHLGKW